MKILVDRLTATPTPFHFEVGSGWWRQHVPRQPDLPSELTVPFRIDVRAHRVGEDVCLEGVVEGELELECGRCLAQARAEITHGVLRTQRATKSCTGISSSNSGCCFHWKHSSSMRRICVRLRIW